ncbi:EamA family transporter [Mucilaginibacter gynuensis]|uniref:EamA family transporter n=1 Tax=Mucilaginibacter gynuensis TaxID=1302236 RepID=UPI0031E81BDB
MKQQTAPSRWLILFAFFNIYIIWGSTYLAVAYGLKGLPPFVLVGARYLVAGVVLFAWCLIKGEKLPPPNLLWRQAVSGILMLVGGTGMIAWAELYISSGQAAILVATEPLWFLLLDKKRWGEYFRDKYIISGLLIGFTGIFLFMKLNHSTQAATVTSTMTIIASGVVLFSAVLWVLCSLITSNSKGNSSTIMNSGVQLLAAGFASEIIALVKGEYIGFDVDKVPFEAWAGLVFLIVMGSFIAYLSFVWLISIRPPALVSTHTYVNPVVAVFLGWIMAGEKVSGGQLIGLVVILVGILLINVPAYRAPAKIQE